MEQNINSRNNVDPNLSRLLAYVADLELEVDRLRRHNHFVHQTIANSLTQIQNLVLENSGVDKSTPFLAEANSVIRQSLEALQDLRDNPGYHPAHDQVVAIAVCPLIEQAFRWQKRLQNETNVHLRLQLEIDYVDWFPARFRHIVNNLIANAFQFRDSRKEEMWIEIGLSASQEAYKIQIQDNGLGLTQGECDKVFDLFFRSAPVRNTLPGVGLAVVRLLVEQSGGTMNVDSDPGKGTTFAVLLPRFEVNDFLA